MLEQLFLFARYNFGRIRRLTTLLCVTGCSATCILFCSVVYGRIARPCFTTYRFMTSIFVVVLWHNVMLQVEA